MKSESRRLVCGMCFVLALPFLSPLALAQDDSSQQQATVGAPCTDMQMAMHKCGQKQPKKQKPAAEQPKTQFPNATRKQPANLAVSAEEAKPLNAGLAASNSHDNATALKDLQPIADSGKSPYARALATLGLAQVKYNSGDTKGAIALQKQALDSNALDNDSYFHGLESLAQMYIADEDYADALTALDTFNKESGAQSADVYALEGNAYYRLQKYPEAVAAIQKAKSLPGQPQPSWDQIEMASYFAMDKYDDAAKLGEEALAKDPNNTALLQNVVTIYMQGNQNQKALALLNRASANADTGEVDFLRGQVLERLGDHAKAKAAVQQALAKGGLKHTGEAYLLLGNVEVSLNDKQAAIAAYQQAEQDPSTSASAQKVLQALQGSKK